MKPSIRNDWVIVLTLFASFSFGANFSTMLHESGHALGVKLGGANVIKFYMHPFKAGHVFFDFDPMARANRRVFLLYAWGGIVGGTIFSLLALTTSRLFKRGSSGWHMTFMTGILGLVLNGVYLVLGSIQPYGDTSDLVHILSVPRVLLFFVGLPMLAAAAWLFPKYILALGFDSDARFWRWLVPAEVGFLGYFLLMVGYNLFITHNSPGAPMILAFLGGFALLCAAGTAIAYVQRRKQRQQETFPSLVNGTVVLCAAVLMVMFELLALQ